MSRGGGELNCRGTQIYLGYTLPKVYEMCCMIFYSFWLGRWDFHFHGGTLRFQATVPSQRAFLEALFLSVSPVVHFLHLSVFLSKGFHYLSVRIGTKMLVIQFAFHCIWEFYWEFLGILPHCVVWCLFLLFKILSFLLWLWFLKFLSIDNVSFFGCCQIFF